MRENLILEAQQYKSIDEFSIAMYKAYQAIRKYKYYEKTKYYDLSGKFLSEAFAELKTDTVTIGDIENSNNIDIAELYNLTKQEG